MSFFKGLVLIILSILLVVFLVIFQVDNTLNSTALSPGYFNNAFDKNVTQDSIENFAVYLKDNVGDVGSEELNKIVRDAINVKWLQKDMPVFLKGCFAFFTTGEGKLPSISIKPMKEALSKAIASQAGAASALVESQIGLDDVKDNLDLNLIVNKMYGGSANPVTGFGVILSNVRSSFLLIIVLAALLLFAAIAVIAYHPRSIMRWSGACLVAAGILCLIPAVVPALLNHAITTQVAAAVGSSSQPNLLFLQNLILSFAGGVSSFMMIQSLIVTAIGSAFLIAANFMSKETRRPAQSDHIAVRAIAALLLLAAIPFSGYMIMRNLYPHVKEFNSTLRVHEKMTFGEAFDATMGGKLGKIIDNSSK